MKNSVSTPLFNLTGLCALLVLLFALQPETAVAAAESAAELDFYQAVKRGDTERVAQFLDEGVSINARDEQGNTALVYASAQGFPEVVKLLISRKVNLDEIGGQWTGLMAAAYYGHRKIVAMLLAAGAKPEQKNPHGKTALAYAVFNNQLAAAEELLMGGADVNQSFDVQAMSPLILAARKTNPEMVKLLLTAGADVNYLDSTRRSAVFYAALKQHLPTMDQLVNAGANLDQRDARGHALLTSLARSARPEVFAWLVEHGADLNLTYRDQSPLLIAARAGNSGVVKYLLSSKRAMSQEQQASAYLVAVEGGSLKTLQVFIEAGMDVDSADDQGVTALMVAAKQRHKRLVTYLIRKGAKLDQRDRQGRTALMYAVEAEPLQLSIVRSLIENGADVQVLDNAGHNALQRLVRDDPQSQQIRRLITASAARAERPLGFLSD